jgi:hypothetical protein
MTTRLIPLPLLAVALAAGAPAFAQASRCYTADSLYGSYAVVGNYGAHVASAIQAELLDGRGNLTRTGVINQPLASSTTGQRTVGNVVSNGTYTVNCNGTGVINRLVTRPDGTTAVASDDFLITEAVEQDGRLLATTIVDVQRDPSVILPGGVFLTRVHTRRPDTRNVPCYTAESLEGSYSVVNSYGNAVALGMQAETLDGKGALTRTGPLNQPLASSTTGQRTVGIVTSNGTYTVNCNGTGVINRVVTRPDGTTATASDDFIITRAIESNGRLIATSIVDVQRDPSVILGGIFLTREHTRRPYLTLPGSGGGVTPAAVTKAVAGPKDATATTREFQLDGTQSTSADGKPLTYLWTIPDGSPSAAILGANTATPTVQFGQGRQPYTFQLTVTDSTGQSATDLVTVHYLGN